MRKRKILIFHQSGDIGGAGLSLLHIIDNIDQDRFDIVVALPGAPRFLSEEIGKRGIKTIVAGKTPIIFPHFNGGIKYALDIRTLLNIYELNKDIVNIEQIIVNERPDILAVNSITLSYIGILAKKYNIKTICFDRETFQKGILGFRTNIIKYWMQNFFDKIVFISQFDANQLKCDANKKVIIHDKVDLSLYNQDEIEKVKRKVLYLGGISKLKGIHIMLGCVNYVENEELEYYLVAEEEIITSSVSIFDKICYLLGIRSVSLARVAYHAIKDKTRIHFLDKTMKPEEYINDCDILVFPSTVAHQARPVFEAGAAMKPIIITDFNATKEFCGDGENVICFKKSDVTDLAKKIDNISKNSILSDRITRKNYELTYINHNLRDLRSELECVLSEI